MSAKSTVFRAKLVQKQGQKTCLTYTTAPQVSWALYQLYPFLIIFDGLLNNLMWCCDDICLPFIYLVLMTLVVSCESVLSEGSNVLGSLVNSWFGLMSGAFIMFSCMYYVSSVLWELKQDESPTLDDIVVMMDNVHYKLEKMREDVARVFRLQRRDFPFLLIVLTPLNWLVATYLVSSENYVKIIVTAGLVFHSSWCQCTLRLIWRSLFARHLWFIVCKRRDSTATDRDAHRYTVLRPALDVVIPRELALLESPQCAVKLKPYVRDATVRGCEHLRGDPNFTWTKVETVEYRICENQRKWPLDGWTHNTLAYERTKFTTGWGKGWQQSVSPWEFQESLEPDWFWIDDGWMPHDWDYCDADWNMLGSKDSLDCYTRSRSWTRSAFRKLSPQQAT
ncbi:LAME_0D09274g1_1 [Lachancea meyersii CBS 8951]|uniref:LAME_0D09274g1_1 n=1 Tax=Lachancea meyersii CBS 8951 TaxID=1266667 RepID=A0A1G4JB98_9SACH|nr:LAME_0D09274g1_1 [Lachancea meyersii CBS 8951]